MSEFLKTNKQTKNCVLNKVAPAKQKRSPGFVWKEVVQKILAVDKTGQSLAKLTTFLVANNGNASYVASCCQMPNVANGGMLFCSIGDVTCVAIYIANDWPVLSTAEIFFNRKFDKIL